VSPEATGQRSQGSDRAKLVTERRRRSKPEASRRRPSEGWLGVTYTWQQRISVPQRQLRDVIV
jgi:hypothetical protein